MDRSTDVAKDSMASRPKLLFLAYRFPPFPSIASVRAGAIASNLAHIGWDVTVVTLDPRLLHNPDMTWGRQAERQLAEIRRIHTDMRWRFLVSGHVRRARHGPAWFAGGIGRRLAKWLGVSEHVGWVAAAMDACRRLTPADVDVILATGCPWEAFQVANLLGKKLRKPYVLDYRDLWTLGNPSLNSRRRQRERFEFRLLQQSAGATVVSPSLAELLRKHFPIEHTPLTIISNGYDPAEFEGVAAARFDEFAIVYTGTFNSPGRDLAPFMQALGELRRRRPDRDWRFHYYGDSGDYVRHVAERFQLGDRTAVHGRVPRHEALAAVRGAGATLIITSTSASPSLLERGVLTGKVFEAIGLGAPIVAITPPASDLDHILETVGRGKAFRASEIPAIVAYLDELLLGNAPPAMDPLAYSWPQLVHRLDRVLRSATGDLGTLATSPPDL